MRLLGEATARSQQLELRTTQLLTRALPVTESTARLLATKMGHAATFPEQVEHLATKLRRVTPSSQLSLLVSGTRIQNHGCRRTRDTPASGNPGAVHS